MICISCKKEHSENFCPNCGEKNGVEKITLSSLFTHAFSSMTNMDKGFLFNLKSLFLNPQEITSDYIAGKRKGILNPMSYLIISITIYLIVITVFRTTNEVKEINNLSKSSLEIIANEVGLFLRIYIKYLWILSIIPLGISLKLVFGKYNLVENFAISSFIIAQATLVGVISFLIFKLPLIFDPFVYFIIFWITYLIFKDNNKKIKFFFLSVLSFILFVMQLSVTILIISIIKWYFR